MARSAGAVSEGSPKTPPPGPPRDQGFPRSLRLRRTADFKRVQSTGRRRGSRHLIVVWHEKEGDARFGLAVSRKVGNAVVRNRVKRWLRESIRRQRHGLTGVDVVFIARRQAAEAGLERLYDEVGAHLRAIREGRPS